jgi:DNA processing protein
MEGTVCAERTVYVLDYLTLVMTPGVGPLTLQRLLERFDDPASVLRASPAELAEVEGIGLVGSRRIGNREGRQEAEQILQFCGEQKIAIVLPHETEFPRLLREIPDPPPLLYVRGSLQRTDQLSVAIVGTRGASHYGRSQAERFARTLARAGLTIVSGLARGIDIAAHRGALEAEGRTLAVLSSGVHEIYPPQHAAAAEQIMEQGALVSEMPPFSRPKRGMFPHRNRLISGLCLGTVVIEAAERSGALITARLAGEQGREVFAVPGLVTSPAARGCHALIRDGACLVQDPEDVLEQLGPLVAAVEVTPDKSIRHAGELQLNDQELTVLQAIEVEPTDLNDVIQRSGLPVARVLSTISVLEMRRLIRRLSGQVVHRL